MDAQAEKKLILSYQLLYLAVNKLSLPSLQGTDLLPFLQLRSVTLFIFIIVTIFLLFATFPFLLFHIPFTSLYNLLHPILNLMQLVLYIAVPYS